MLGEIFWGTGALVVNVLIAKHGFSPESISFWRFALGALVLIAVFGRQLTWRALVAGLVMGLSSLHRPLHWPSELPPHAWFLYLGIVTVALALLAFSWGAGLLRRRTERRFVHRPWFLFSP